MHLWSWLVRKGADCKTNVRVANFGGGYYKPRVAVLPGRYWWLIYTAASVGDSCEYSAARVDDSCN